MTQLYSNDHLDVMIDAHQVAGLADEERPYEFPDGADLFNMVRSQNDGGMYAMTNSGNILGGPFTMRLAPTSPTAQWLIQRKVEMKRALKLRMPIRIFRISFSDAVQGRRCTFEGAILQKCPDMIEPGQTFEVMFECEQIIPNVDGAVFTPPPSLAA